MVDEETDDQGVQVHNLFAQLREGSEYLENQKEALSQLWDRFPGKVVTFYETEPTKSVKKVCRYRPHCIASAFRKPSVLLPLIVREY